METIFDSFDVCVNGWEYTVEVQVDYRTSNPDETPEFLISEFDKDDEAPEPNEAEILQEVQRKFDNTDWAYFLNGKRGYVETREEMFG